MKVILKFVITLSFLVSVTNANTIEKEVLVPSPAAGESRYFYIPFDVPSGVKSLSLTYEYDGKDGQNVLDLGLFDPNYRNGSIAEGFRGWSGGRRSTIFLAGDAATFGYIAGKIPAGTWRVILGLYKVVPEGVKVKISAKVNEVDDQAWTVFLNERSTREYIPGTVKQLPLQASARYNWYRGDLHMHTFNSDGKWTVSGLLGYASAIGLNFIGITDHNTYSHHAEIRNIAEGFSGLLIMRGEEVTTYGGHFNVWGLPDGRLIDFRVTPGDSDRLREVVEQVHSLGLLASINHPTALCAGCNWTYGDDWSNMDSVEVWNGAWDASDEVALAKWDKQLQSGRRLVAIGSSDSHTPPSGPTDKQNTGIGLPTTYVASHTLDEKGILSAIRAGRVVVTDSPGTFLSFDSKRDLIGGEISAHAGRPVPFRIHFAKLPSDAVIRVIVKGQVLRKLKPTAEDVSNFDLSFSANGYIRLEARAADGRMLAFTNPIYISVSR